MIDTTHVAPKPPLTHDVLTDVIDLALWAGQMLLANGADSARIEETVHHVGTGLGCDWMDILVSPNALVITASSGGEFRTKVRRVTRLGVNFAAVDAINDLSRRIDMGLADRAAVRAELRQIADAKPLYNRWLVVGMVGASCAAFGRLFGADFPVIAVTFVAAAAAQLVRQELHKRHLNPYIIVVLTAFAAGLIASTATVLSIGERPNLALAASVLLLVPGVPLINAAEDLIYGHAVTGVVRGLTGALIALCIALGLLLAMGMMGVQGL
ncbi:MAG: threonine/serine exporter family protein [bacterium]|nr:threonine/serine exporter family protein [bacterium]